MKKQKDCVQCRREQRIEQQNKRVTGYIFNIFLSMMTTLLVLFLKKVI